jgi:tetratricopeptide (TPR) repeat protein
MHSSTPARTVAVVATVALCALLSPSVLSHPHLTPEQIQARIQELDALIPVVKRMRLELRVERAALNTRLDRLAEGLLDCRRATWLDPASPKPYRQAGELLEVRGAHELAAAEYEQAVKLGKPDDTTYWRLGNCYRECKRYDRAAAMFRQSATLAVDPLAKAARFVDVAKVAELTGDTKAAEAALAESIRLSQNWPSYLQARAELYMRTKAYRKAAEDFRAIVAKATDGGDEFPMMVRYADALAAAGDKAARAAYEKAEKVISKLLSEDPAFVEDLRYWRGRARFELGNFDGAREDAREALVGLPDQVEYLELMVKIGKAAGETEETRRAVRDLERARAFDIKSREQYEVVLAEMEETVRRALEQATAEALAEAVVEKGLARVRTDEAGGRQTLALAEKKLDALLEKYPDRAPLYAYHRARIQLARGEAREALATVERCVAADAEDARFRRLRLQVAQALGQEEPAAKDEVFLDAIIKRSMDQDLLSPAPPDRREGGGK